MAQHHPAPDAHYANSHQSRQAFQHPHTQMGSAGHWIKTAGILSPLIIHEMIKDPDQKWRWIRIATVATALMSQAMWTTRIRNERRERSSRQDEMAL